MTTLCSQLTACLPRAVQQLLLLTGLLLATLCTPALAQTGTANQNAQATQMDRAVWLSPKAPGGIWQSGFGNPWPVKMIVADLKKVGVNTILFMDQYGRGGTFFHPTAVEHSVSDNMGDRDYLKELLVECDANDISVQLVWTTPLNEYPNTDIQGLDDPRMIRLYADQLREVAKNYGSHKSLRGFMLHELTVTESSDDHKNDLQSFVDFCQKNFGQKYTEKTLPKLDADNVWWRRMMLYRNHVVTDFVRQLHAVAKPLGLETTFCYYPAERWSGEGWRWGFDVLDLDEICDRLWFSGYSPEAGKPYQNTKHPWIDFGTSYRGQQLGRNYGYALHGQSTSFFEMRIPLYVKEVRKHYAAREIMTQRYGDIYNGYYAVSDQSIDLYYGQKNMQNWIGLMQQWQGGNTPASVAVAINPRPFIMQNPASPGDRYDQVVRPLMTDLTARSDVDGLLLNNAFSLNPANLARFQLIIIPQDMGMGLTQEMIKSLQTYTQNGGNVLFVQTPPVVSKKDLSEPNDLTASLLGVSAGDTNPKIDVQTKSQLAGLNDVTFTKLSLQSLKLAEATTIVSDTTTGQPLLTRKAHGKGAWYYSAVGYTPSAAGYFQAVIEAVAKPAITLKADNELRILEATSKDNALLLSLWGKGKGTLTLNPSALSLPTGNLIARDLLTGQVFFKGDASSLAKGIAIEVLHEQQPMVLVIGAEGQWAAQPSLYDSAEVFAGNGEQILVENPEVPITRPAGKGLVVGVYHRNINAAGLMEWLENIKGVQALSLPRIDGEALNACDVLILANVTVPAYVNQAGKLLRSWVSEGGSIILMHDAVGFRQLDVLFPELGRGFDHPKLENVVVSKKHWAITRGFKEGDAFKHAYADHVAVAGVPKKTVILLRDDRNNGVLITGPFGKGKVVLSGMLTGYASITPGDYKGENKAPEGAEAQIMENVIRWSVRE